MSESGKTTLSRLAVFGILGTLLVAVLVWEYRKTQPVRGAVRSFSALVTAANRGEIETVRALCSENYRRTHRLEKAPEGGVVGFPRNIHKNFQTWTRDHEVWICSGNRMGPVYRMVPERGRWVFDGLEGYLAPTPPEQPS